jgi:hypothetical protein
MGKVRAELVAITDEDVAAVAGFLRTNLNDRVPWEQACTTVPWQVAAPNRGFMLRDGQRVVGTLLAVYSERLVAGRVERFCNMGSWCVLPEYRSRSISLLNAIMAQPGYDHFTVLSPGDGPQEVLEWLKFRRLETSAAIVPNLPWPTLPGRTRVSTDPAVIENTLTADDLDLYRDHVRALAAHHVVLVCGGESCYVIYRELRYGGVPAVAVILHVSNPDVFHRAVIPLTRHLLVRCGLVATLVELRLVGHAPRMSFKLDSWWPKMYRSDTLESEQIDYLYSELVCVGPRSRDGVLPVLAD